MKKAILFISTLLALGMLSACGAGEQANETAASSVPAEPAKSDLTAPSVPFPDSAYIPAQQRTEEPILDSPGFLTDEQQQIYEQAQSVAYYIMGDPSNVAYISGNQPGESIKLGDSVWSYTLVTGRDENYTDFQQRMLDIFTQEFLDEHHFDRNFVSVNGQLAALSGGTGSRVEYCSGYDQYQLTGQTEDTLSFDLIAYYAEQNEGESDADYIARRDAGDYDYSERHPNRFVKTVHGWRLDQYSKAS